MKRLSRRAMGLLVCWIAFWVGLFVNNGWVLAAGWAGCVVLGVLEAREKRRSVAGWATSIALVPLLVPPVLAFLPQRSLEGGGVYVTKSFLGNQLGLAGDVLTVRQFGFPMRDLRYVSVLLPGSGWTVLVHSSQTRSCIDLDLLSEAEHAALCAQLTQRAKKGGLLAGLGEIVFCLADYRGNHAQFSLADVKQSRLDVLGELGKHRGARLAARREWFGGDARVTLPGAFFGSMEMDRAGVHMGRQHVAWKDVGTVQVHTVNGIAAHFYVIPQGVSSGAYSFSKGKYGMNISVGRADMYTCEANFWRLSARVDFLQAPGGRAEGVGAT